VKTVQADTSIPSSMERSGQNLHPHDQRQQGMYRLGPFKSSGRSLFSNRYHNAAAFTAGQTIQIQTGGTTGKAGLRMVEYIDKLTNIVCGQA